MTLLHKLARHSFWLLIARVGGHASMVLVTYLLARRLGTAGFGEYAFIATAIVIGNTLTTFGTDMYLIREIAAKSDFSELPAVLALQLVLSGLFIAFIFWFAPRFPNQTAESILALKVYSFAMFPLAFFTVFTSVLRGTQRMSAYAWLVFIPSALQAAGIFFFVQPGTSLVALAYLLLGVQLFGAICAGAFCVSYVPKLDVVQVSLGKMKNLLAACLPIALIAIVGIVYQKLSLTMLSFLGAASMVGVFSAAARVMEAARLGHFVALTALYPAMAHADQHQLSKTSRTSWFVLLLFSVVGSILVFWLAQPVVAIFFGGEYALSVPVLKILAFTLVPYTINSFLSLLFLAQKKEPRVLQILTVSALIIFVLNLWFIPRMGEVGASWVLLVVEWLQACLFLAVWQMKTVSSKGVSYELSDLP